MAKKKNVVHYYGVGRNFTVKSGKHNDKGLTLVGQDEGVFIFTSHDDVRKYKKHCEETEQDKDAYYRLLDFGEQKPIISPMVLNPQNWE